MDTPQPHSINKQVLLGTISFTLCFAAWGLISAFAPRFRILFGLSATQTAILVAAPVLLGALARIPMGILTDKFGGRAIFFVLILVTSVWVFLIPSMTNYQSLLVVAFFLGIAGSSFAVGVGYLSRWSPAERQGSVLGIFGVGNVGQSIAVFLGPVVAAVFGWEAVFKGGAALLILWGIVFGVMARNAPGTVRLKGLRSPIATLARERLFWALALFYAMTFGGFISFSIYLPILLRDEFGLSPIDAGFRAAGFVVLAALLRPMGGWLSDRIGGTRVLSSVFLGLVPFAMLLAWPVMLPFTVGALGCAVLLGLGNGAVFKLVPQYFPVEVGTVSGFVGAIGGMGGFFPPLLLGFSRDYIGATWPAFLLLAVTSLLLWNLNRRVFVLRQEALEATLPMENIRAVDQIRAWMWSSLWTGLLIAAIVVGSRNLQHFDPALVIYTFAVIFAMWGVFYHYAVWLQKPPTRIYWRRGWQLFLQQGIFRSLLRTGVLMVTYLGGQTFIRRRSHLRWWMHQLIFWGCLLAVAITFPMVFGWIHFGSLPDDQMTYVTYLFGFPILSFRLQTMLAWLIFHTLDFAAVLVLAGITLSLWRRMREKGVIAVQSFVKDFFPLVLLCAVSVTGLALTVSAMWLYGVYYDFLAILHAITVITTLLCIPFGKFFHIFQRPAQFGIKLYQQAGEKDEGAHCVRCGTRFASRMHIDDLKQILPQLGFDYTIPGSAGCWQELCPACKRKTIATAQLRMKEESHG